MRPQAPSAVVSSGRVAGTLFVLASLVLSSCSAAPESASSARREALHRGVRLCINNDSSMNMRVTWGGRSDSESLPPAGQNCLAGTAVNGPDVWGVITYEPVSYPGTWLTLNVKGWNPNISFPQVSVNYTAMAGTYGMCLSDAEGTESSMQSGWIRGTIRRENDSERYKEFVVTFFDRENKRDSVQELVACDGNDPVSG